jgi:hypothetical protein
MKIWIQSDGKILFEVGHNHFVLLIIYPIRNKRFRIREADIISFASSSHIYTVFPSDFISMYYTEEVRYWHELRRD